MKLPQTDRARLLAIAVAALILLNLWRWWPAGNSPESAEGGIARSVLTPEDFRLPGVFVASAEETTIRRNLFRTVRTRQAASKRPHRKVASSKPSKRQRAEQRKAAVLAELNAYKLVGVVFREGKGEAFLVKGASQYTVSKGDRLENRFLVDQVDTDTVTLRDTKGGQTGILELSGDQ